jgi:peptidylprolyl isomerase domain and WD repeat-containing protein 1
METQQNLEFVKSETLSKNLEKQANKRKFEEEQSKFLPTKKTKKSSQFLEKLPSSMMYERSYMHDDNVTHTLVIPNTGGFVVTASQNGVLKFWKKTLNDIEFVKQYKAHLGEFKDLCCSSDGQLLATCSNSDKTIKIFDVINFDMINMISLEFEPELIQFVHSKDSPNPRICVVEKLTNTFHVYNPKEDGEEISNFKRHSNPVKVMKYNAAFDSIVSIDEKGFVEYSNPSDFKLPTNLKFKIKSTTNLFEFVESKTYPTSLEFNSTGTMFVCMSKDKFVRVFHYETGKLYRKYDETDENANRIQKEKIEELLLDNQDFLRRMKIEQAVDQSNSKSNAVFDETGSLIIYPTYMGIKFINLKSNEVEKLIGKFEHTERFLNISLFQDKIVMTQDQLAKLEKKRKKAIDLSGGSNSNEIISLYKVVDFDPTLFCCAFSKKRFYLFTKREPDESEIYEKGQGRDIFNEKPTKEETVKIIPLPKTKLGKKAIIHTDLGDIFLKLYPDYAPKTVENFTVHSNNGYYNNLIFHRVIKGFMIQTGDPKGDGTGGTSIWGKDFEDEFDPNLRFEQPGVLAMANTSSPNTNGSQFFITTTVTKWLNDKHTIFGEVILGSDVVESIERVDVDKTDKPKKEIKIINIEIFTEIDEE